MESYPNNSDAYIKASRNVDNVVPAATVAKPEEEPKPEPIITGEVKKKKKTFGDKVRGLFIREDAKTVSQYVFGDILIPALRNTIVDMIRNGAEMFFLGNTRGPRYYSRDDRSPRIQYQNYYDRDMDYQGRRPQYSREPVTPTYSYDDITFESRADAEAVLLRLRERIYESGAVSVAFLYSLIHWKSDYTADGYGWRDLRNAQVILVRDGYWLKLPQPVVI